VAEGKVRQIGCSNFSVPMLDEALAAAGAVRFVSVQNQYSVLHRAPEGDGVLEWCGAHDTAFLPYFPLASGLLSGKYRAGETAPEGSRLAGLPEDQAARTLSDESLGRVAALQALAAESGHGVLDLAVAWLLHHPVVASVIAGATRPEQVRGNAAAGAWSLPDEAAAAVDAIAPG
jgi:aryl-alcohol dehydrogenase-like predicted oxidoreductase